MSSDPTFEQIADLAKVSIATVSRVVNHKGNVSPASRERVLRAMDSLGRALPPRTLVGMIVPEFRNPFFAALHDVLEHALEPHDAHLITSSSDGDAQRELKQVKRFQALGVAGLVYVGVGGSSEALLQLVAESDLPVVVFDRRVNAMNIDSVVVDNEIGMQRAVDYLALSGHVRIAHMMGIPGTETTAERLEGFKSAMDASGLEFDESLIFEGDFTFESGERVGDELLAMDSRDRPTAMVAANDLEAMGVIRKLASAGWKLPDELSIIGFDDIPQCAQIHPSLTTVAMPVREMAQAAVALLLSRAKSNSQVVTRGAVQVFPPRLIVRESVRAR